MTLGRVASKPIDEPGLGRAEEEPVTPGLLQRDEELLTTVYARVLKIHDRISIPHVLVLSF